MCRVANEDIRKKIESSGLKYWEIADAVGIDPSNLSVWMRHELTGRRRDRVLEAIGRVQAEKGETA